jgi:hypothetical protein
MNLLKNFLNFINGWEDCFSRPEPFNRSIDHAFANLLAPLPHTITSIIRFMDKEQQDWSADYYFYSRAKWDSSSLFISQIKESIAYFGDSVVVAGDDTAVHKTGRKIKTAFYQRDPMSPPFHSNLLYGVRFLQLSLTLPLYQMNSSSLVRAIPVHFEEAPAVKKPGKRASEETWERYKKAKKEKNLSIQMVNAIEGLRASLDQVGAYDKNLIDTLDGAFCNRYCLNSAADMERTTTVVRCRKDIKLCLAAKHPKSKSQFYAKRKFTPESVYNNPKIPWEKCKIFRAGKYRMTKYKVVKDVFWQTVTKRIPLTLIVLKRIPYHPRKGHTSYRQPAFLLVLGPEITLRQAIQAYHDHLAIELNIKEEKSIIGIGDAQVSNENSVERQPAFAVCAYSALLLSSVVTYQDIMTPQLAVLPSWRKQVTRPSITMLIRQLKKELLYDPTIIFQAKLPPQAIEMVLKLAA